MDFQSMKRKQLKALCKQHKIPANLSNRDMADKLTEYLKEKENPVVHAVMEEQEEIVNKVESYNVAVNRKGKKVRFSPEHELIEFSRVQQLKRRSRRNSTCRTDSNWSVEVVESSEVNKETVGRRGRTTRAGELRIMEEEINQKKRGVKTAKCNDGKTVTSAVEISDDDKLEEGDAGKPSRGRVTRLRAKMEAQVVKNTSKKEKKGAKQDGLRDEKVSDNNEKHEDIASAVEILEDDTLEEIDAVEPGRGRITRSKAKVGAWGVKNISTREKKGTKDGNKRDGKASDDFNNEKHDENAGNHSRVTRSRSQKLTEAPQEAGKRGRRVVKNIDKVSTVGVEAVDKGESGKGTSATVSAEGMSENGEGLKENLVNKQTAGEHATVESQVPLRRSKRKANMFGDSEIFNQDMKKHENDGLEDAIRTSKFGSRVDAEVTVIEANPERSEIQKIEEPIKKLEPRRSNRRKTVFESDDLKAEPENRSPLRTSVPPSDLVPEVSKDEKMVLQPIGVMRRSRRKTLGLALDSANYTDSVVENLEVEKHISEPCLVEKENSSVQNKTSSRSSSKCKSPEKIGGDSNVQHNNKVQKQKRGHVSRGDGTKKNNHHNSGAQSLKGSGSKKIVSSVDAGNFADEGKQPHKLDNPNMLDASLHSSSVMGESFFFDVQLAVSTDSERSRNICSENIISDMELTSTKEEVSIADRAGVSCINFTNGEELANSGTNAAFKIAQLGKSSTVSEDNNCTSNVKEVEKGSSLLEVDAQQSTEKCTTEVDKNPESIMYIQMEDSGCNIKINDQVLTDGLNVSVKDVNNLKAAEIEADERLQSCTVVVDHRNDSDYLEASNNILDNNNEDASRITGEVGIFVSHETDCSYSTGTSKVKEPSSSMTRHHADNVTEGNGSLFHKGVEVVAEAVEDSCSKECGNASNHIGEFDMLDLCSGETCEKESSKDHSSNCDEDGEKECSLANLSEAEGIYGITPQDSKRCRGETHEGESSEGHMSKSDEDGEFSLANLFDSEGRFGITPQHREKFSGENLVTNFDEQGMLHDFTFVAPIIMCNSTGDHEANLSVEGKPFNYKDKPSELTEADESGRLESHKKAKDEDYEFSFSNLFDGEKSTWTETLDLPAVSTVKDLNERGPFPNISAVSPVSNGLKPGGDSSNSQETNPSTPCSISETQDPQKSHSAKSSALVNSKQQEATRSNASELAGNAVCLSKSYTEGKNILVSEGFSADEDGKEDSAGASDVKNCLISKIAAESQSDMESHDSLETEHQHKNLQARLAELHAETAFHNLFGTTSDTDASPGLDDSFREGSETENMTMSKNKSTTNGSGSLTKQKGKEMERDSRNECAETKYNDVVVLPTGFNADIYENELKRLFATPAKIITPFKTEETHSHDRILDSSVTSMKKCCDTMKGNVATESMPDEKTQNAGYEVENNLPIGIPLSDNGGDDICEEIKAHNTSEGGNIQNTEAIVESSDDDLQKLDLPAHSHLLTACSDDSNVLRETSVETYSDPEEEKIGSCQKDVADKGIFPSLLTEASPDCEDSTRETDDQYGAKILNEEDVNPKLSQDISDELHTNNEEEIRNNVSIGQSLRQELGQFPSADELQSTCKEAKVMGITDAVPEHESYVFGAVSGPISSLENGDTNLEAGELSNNAGDGTCGKIYKADAVKLKDTSTKVLSKIEHDGCEASEEQLTENTGECEKETDFVTEDDEENFVSLGQSCLYDGNTISLSGSPNNFDELNECQDMLIDTVLSESLNYNSRVNHKSEKKMAQSCNAALELSDADLQKSNVSKISHLTSCFEDISVEASLNTGPLIAELANVSGPDSQSMDTGTALHHSSNVSPVHDELTLRDNADDLNGDKICDEIDANEKSSKDECEEAEKLPCSVELENALLEAKETGTITQDMKTDVAPAENGSSVCGAVSNILSCSEMHLHQREDIDEFENLDATKPVFNLSGDSGTKNNEKAEGKSTAHMVEFSFQELHFEENVEDFKNDDTQTISNSPVTRCNEMLKESDVADTIKEYIDSESSLSVIFENSADSPSSHMLPQTDERIACENSALSKHEDDIIGSLANLKDEDNTPSVNCLETEIKEPEEATLFIEPAQDSGNAANSAGCVGQFTEGSVKLDAQKKVEFETGRSTMRKNVRTILIHGTPNKLLTMADMKENALTQKRNIGDVTITRPAKRRALQDVHWK